MPEHSVKTHLFIIGPNNSGTTFLKQALATCQNTWNLPREGQNTFGYSGPCDRELGCPLLWAAKEESRRVFQSSLSFDWETTKKAWYFQATARSARASIFVEKSPPFLLCVPELARNFKNSRFLFLLRDPYAVVEGIVRNLGVKEFRASLVKKAAIHLLECFKAQDRNLRNFGRDGTFFTYEAMCDRSRVVEQQIRDLIPDVSDLKLDRCLSIKGNYRERLRNMNEQQWAALSSQDFELCNEIFQTEETVLRRFGYTIR